MQVNTTAEAETGFVYQRNHLRENPAQTHEMLTDEELVRGFLVDQDEGAFNEIVSRYTDKIYRLALKITRNPSDAEEVLQEVFLILIEKLYTFREDSKFSTWLYRVAANASYLKLKGKNKYVSNISLEDYAPYDRDGILQGIHTKDWSSLPDEVLLSQEGAEIIEKAVNELPEPYRVVFHLRDVEGLKNEEVGEILGLSLPAVKSRILRARLFLRDKLSDYFYEQRK